VLAAVLPCQVQAVAHLTIGVVRYGHLARLRKTFEASRDVDPVAQQVAALGHHIAHMDSDAKANLPAFFDILIARGHSVLHGNSTSHGIHSARELEQQTIAGGVGDAAAMLFDQPIDQVLAMSAQRTKRTFLVLADQTGVASDVSGHDRCQPAVLALHQRPPLRRPF
jgi:hypothetical protein